MESSAPTRALRHGSRAAGSHGRPPSCTAPRLGESSTRRAWVARRPGRGPHEHGPARAQHTRADGCTRSHANDRWHGGLGGPARASRGLCAQVGLRAAERAWRLHLPRRGHLCGGAAFYDVHASDPLCISRASPRSSVRRSCACASGSTTSRTEVHRQGTQPELLLAELLRAWRT
jgi:hypothetical protein